MNKNNSMTEGKGFFASIMDTLLNKPGDSFSARITKSNRRVIKLNKGNETYSITKYENGTTVETRSIRRGRQ